MDAFVYARLSRDRSGVSPNCEIQIQECHEYAAETGISVLGVSQDNDISASQFSTAPREGYDNMLGRLRLGEAEMVLCTEMPRLYRRLEELLELIHLAEHTRLKKIETTDHNGYDLSTGQGIHNAVSAVNNAMLESRKLSDRVRRKKRVQAKDGVFNGGPRPFGYEGDGVTVRESEAEALRMAAMWILAGRSMRTLVTEINQRGALTPTGKPWHVSSLRRVLKSKRIVGVRVHGESEYPAQWPAILDRQTWDELQLVLNAEERLRMGQKRGPRVYLLADIACCALCGKPLKGRLKLDHRGYEPMRRYVCEKWDNYGRDRGCGGVGALAEPVEVLVTDAVLYRLDSPEVAKAFADAEKPEIQHLLDEYNSQKLRISETRRAYANGELSLADMIEIKNLLEEAMERTRERLAKLETHRAFAAIPPGQTIRDAWEATPDLEWRRSLIRLLVEKVLIHPGRPGAHRWKHESGREWIFRPERVEVVWKA